MIGKAGVVREDCVAWTTAANRKTGAVGPDANAKPVDLKAGEAVTVVGVALDVLPRSLLVTRSDPAQAAPVEIRERFVQT
jgi:hypothetical protein